MAQQDDISSTVTVKHKSKDYYLQNLEVNPELALYYIHAGFLTENDVYLYRLSKLSSEAEAELQEIEFKEKLESFGFPLLIIVLVFIVWFFSKYSLR